MNTQRPKIGGRSPWGKIQDVQDLADGVWFVSTSSHGGIKLSRKLQNEMPECLRQKTAWYEEDCEASLVMVGLQRYFHEEKWQKSINEAHQSAKNWFPDEYHAFTKQPVPVEESYVLTKRKFSEDNKNNYVTTACWGDWHQDVPKGMVACFATIGGDRTTQGKLFLVPEQEYATRTIGGFIIDTNKYQEIQSLKGFAPERDLYPKTA